MPKKETPKALLSKHLGPQGANALLRKIDQMVADGASAAKIEKAASEDIAAHIERQIIGTLTVKIGPLEPIKIKPIQVAIKPTIKPLPATKVSTGISVKIGPPVYTKGTR